MSSPATCPAADPALDAAVAHQRVVIAELEQALWAGGLAAAALAPYQAAWRDLEALLARRGDPRHGFVLVIPVADNPRQTRACLDSLLELCRTFGYGGERGGHYRKVRVLLADDSQAPGPRAEHRALAETFTAAGLTVEYFGQAEQLALLDQVDAAELVPVLGVHDRADFSHKGQAMMRNIAYLHLARWAPEPEGTLFYTVDGDQLFRVAVATPEGGREACAVNYLFHLDEIFRQRDVAVLTGKVVGDPPVSPAVMAGNFLDDVLGFLTEMADAAPEAPYRQPAPDGRGGDAAYHDMADLFGFRTPTQAYRFRCDLAGAPDNAACFAAFAGRLNRFFHGEHPTRVTWFNPGDALASVQPARTVYTGNYVFRPEALDWFIPFAPLRLRMSGPTLGRLLQAELGPAFASANLPMLHRRTVADTGASEFRPGVRDQASQVDLCDEFERQFHGDVMLFAVEGLARRGFPGRDPAPAEIKDELAATQRAMGAKYRARHEAMRARLAEFDALFADPARWWHGRADLAEARARFRAFAANLARHFGADSPCLARIEAEDRRRDWLERQARALSGLARDRVAWRRALAQARLRP